MKARKLGWAALMASIAVAGSLVSVALAQNGTPSATTTTTTATTVPTTGKIVICHRTGSKKKASHTITVATQAWKAHQRHGDTLGACATTPPSTTTTTTTTQTTTTTGTTTTAAPTSASSSKGKGNGNAGGNGKKNGHG